MSIGLCTDSISGISDDMGSYVVATPNDLVAIRAADVVLREDWPKGNSGYFGGSRIMGPSRSPNAKQEPCQGGQVPSTPILEN